MRSAPQKQPRPNTAVLIPSGKGGLRDVPSTACLSGMAKAGCSLPGSASVGMTILVLWRLKNTSCLLGCFHVLDLGARRDLLQSEADYGLAYRARARLRPSLAQQIRPAVRDTS